MTNTNFCRLCASDEGVFLDIFTATDRQLGNRSFLKEFETCLSVKIKQDETLSTKICHRCAIELGQCNEFVEKYYRAYETTLKQKITVARKSCCMCLSTAKNNYIYTLSKDFCSAIDPLQKIYKCFNRQIKREEAERRSICLLCRYNLDVLFDLKKLASEVDSKLNKIAEGKDILSNLPKTETFVVNRKTTTNYRSKAEIKTTSDSESDSVTMARKSSRTKKVNSVKSSVESKFRTCGQCNTSIKGGIDMYRLHSSGITVCKMCWITMDPFNPGRGSKRKMQNNTEGKNTRLCTVFLKDVLSPASSKNDSPPKLDKEEQEDEIYVISDDSSICEEEFDERPKKKLRNRRVNISSGESDTISKKRSLRQGAKKDKTANKKLRSSKSEAPIVPSTPRRSTRYQSSDSESVKGKSKQGNTSKTKTAKRLTIVDDDCSEDEPSQVKESKNDGKRKRGRAKNVESKSEDSAGSGGDGTGKELRKTNDQNSTTNQLPEASDSPDFTSTNEKSTQKEIPTSTTPPKTEYDQSDVPDHQTEAEAEKEKETIRQSEISQSIEHDDQIADVANAKELTELVSSSNDLPLEQESNDSNTANAENVVSSELPTESNVTLQEVNETSPEVNSMTETNAIDLDETIKLFKENIDGDNNEEKETVEDLDKTIDNIVNIQNTEDEGNDKEDSDSSKITTRKDAEKEKDSGKELERNIDISIADTGSSAEDSRGQTEKCNADNTQIVENITEKKQTEEKPKETEEKPKETEEDSKANCDENKDTLNEETNANISSTSNLDENPDAESSKSNGLSLQVEEENEKECGITEENEKLREDVQPPSGVTEVSQEVMELATAEVKKRIESEESSVTETLEKISEEINKTSQGSPAVDQILANNDTAMSKEKEPCEEIDSIDLNSTENLSKK